MLNAVAIDDESSYLQLIKDGNFSAIAERIGSSPFLWIGAAVFPVAAGGIASMWPEKIKEEFWPFFLCRHVGVASSLFWFAVIGTGLCFGLGQWSQSRAGTALRVMVRRLQTLPPTGFLEAFRASYRESAHVAFLTVLSENQATVPQVEHAIRNVLGAIVECARDFDEKNRAIYGANIMLWRPRGTPFESKKPRHLGGYLDCDQSVKGYLELVPSLSTTTELQKEGYTLDKSVAPITLPIPVDTGKILDRHNHSRDPVLPGAPQAFAQGTVIVFESRDGYIKWLDDHSSRDLSLIKELKEYFLSKEGREMRSFGSQPILKSGGQKSEDAIAVLNIHSNEENMLQDSGQTLFAPLIEPFCVLLAILLQQRELLLASPATGATNVSDTSKQPASSVDGQSAESGPSA